MPRKRIVTVNVRTTAKALATQLLADGFTVVGKVTEPSPFEQVDGEINLSKTLTIQVGEGYVCLQRLAFHGNGDLESSTELYSGIEYDELVAAIRKELGQPAPPPDKALADRISEKIREFFAGAPLYSQLDAELVRPLAEDIAGLIE